MEVRERIARFEPGSLLETEHEAGFDGCVRWQFQEIPDGTRVTFEGRYELPATLLQSFANRRFVQQAITADVRHGLSNLRRMLRQAQ